AWRRRLPVRPDPGPLPRDRLRRLGRPGIDEPNPVADEGFPGGGDRHHCFTPGARADTERLMAIPGEIQSTCFPITGGQSGGPVPLHETACVSIMDSSARECFCAPP